MVGSAFYVVKEKLEDNDRCGRPTTAITEENITRARAQSRDGWQTDDSQYRWHFPRVRREHSVQCLRTVEGFH